jgi:hypothetical protein
MSVVNPTVTDYRAWIAIIWSVLFFAVVLVMALTNHSVNDIVIVTAIFTSPVGMIIAFYFGTKQQRD